MATRKAPLESLDPFRISFLLVTQMEGYQVREAETPETARMELVMELQAHLTEKLREMNRDHEGLDLGIIDFQVREIPL